MDDGTTVRVKTGTQLIDGWWRILRRRSATSPKFPLAKSQPQCAPLYYYYGDALLQGVESKSLPFGDEKVKDAVATAGNDGGPRAPLRQREQLPPSAGAVARVRFGRKARSR